MERKHKLFDGLSILLGGLMLPVAGSTLCIIFLSYWFWQNLLIHTAVEALGGFIAWLMAIIILVMRRQNQIEPIHFWTSCALLGMGTLDFLHSCVPPGITFVWLHSTATLVGGVFFAMTWLPQRIAKLQHLSYLPAIITIIVFVFGVFSILFPPLLPAMVSQGNFALTSRVINTLGGILFVSASIRFYIKYKRTGNREDFIFTNHCLLFGTAGLLFEFSVLWNAGWWWWHFLRLSAYLLALCYLFVIYRKLEETATIAHKQYSKEATKRIHLYSELEKYQLLVDNISDLAYICDTEGNILFLNWVFEKLSGHKPEEFIGKSFAPLFDEENLKKAMELYTRTLEGETLKRELYFKDTGILCEYKNMPLRDREGNIIGVLGIARDITERKNLENELQNINKLLEQRVAKRTEEWAKANETLQIKIVQHTKTQELLQSVLDNSPAVIYIKDKNGKYLLINYQLETLFHVNRDEVVGKTDIDIFPKEVAEAFQANDRKVLEAGVPLEFEEIASHDDGPNTYISLKFPLFDSRGIPDRICGISTNITKRKRTEEKLASYQTQLKHISSELSSAEERERRRISETLHDGIGQTLTIVKMNLEELKDSQVDTDNYRILNETGELLNKTIEAIRTLTFEISPPILYELGFEPAVEWLIEEFRERHNISIDYSENSDGKMFDDDISSFLFKSVRELLFNVIKHARADKIIVSVRREKNRISISIEDDGVGFDFSKVQFSVDALSGFGLFNIRERMEHFGGNFDVESKPGQGTCITLAMSLKQQKRD